MSSTDHTDPRGNLESANSSASHVCGTRITNALRALPRRTMLAPLVWFLCVFVLFVSGPSLEQRETLRAELASQTDDVVRVRYKFWAWGSHERELEPAVPPSLGLIEVPLSHAAARAIRMELSDEGDTHRYSAYIAAALGRPFTEYFVRTLPEWMADFQRAKFTGKVVAYNPTVPLKQLPYRLTPYKDFSVEYPPGFWLWAMPPALISSDVAVYPHLFSLWMATLLTLALLVAFKLKQMIVPGEPRSLQRVFTYGTLLALALGVVTTMRFDSAVALLVVLAIYWTFKGRLWLSGGAIGVGFATKLVPLLIAPLLLLYILKAVSGSRIVSVGKFISGATLGMLALVAPAWYITGPSLFDLFIYHSQRPLEIESIWAGGLGLWHHLTDDMAHREYSYGSVNFWSPWSDFFVTMSKHGMLASIAILGLLTALLVYRSKSLVYCQRLIVVSSMITLILFALIGGVFSPQYLVWVMPLSICTFERKQLLRPTLMIAVFFLSQMLYPVLFKSLAALDMFSLALSLVRSTLLFLFVGLTWRYALRAPLAPRVA